NQPAPKRSAPLDGHVHGSVAFHRAGDSQLGLFTSRDDKPGAYEKPEEHREYDDQQRATDEFGGGELPAHQQGQDDAQLDDEVGGADLERHGGGEAGTFA